MLTKNEILLVVKDLKGIMPAHQSASTITCLWLGRPNG